MARSPHKSQTYGKSKVSTTESYRLKDHMGKSHDDTTTSTTTDPNQSSDPVRLLSYTVKPVNSPEGTFGPQSGWMTVSSGVAPHQPLVQSVRTFLATEPCKLIANHPADTNTDVETPPCETIAPDPAYLECTNERTLLKRNDLNNNTKNKLNSHKNPEEQQSESNKQSVGGNMAGAAERLQRQPLLARCIKQQDINNLPTDESDPDPEDTHPPHSHLSNGDFQIEIPSSGREERYPKEVWKTVLSFLFVFFCVTINMLSLSLTHERLPDHALGRLPDIFLDNVAAIEWALNASEILIMLSTATATAVIIFHKHRFIVSRRVFFIIGLLYLYRSVTMFVTVLPVSSTTYYCSPKSNNTTPLLIFERMVYLFSGFGLSINGKHIYCGDSIYSGHTMILVLSYLVIAEYSPRRGFALHWAAGAAALAGVLLILLAHAHYVVDIVIAYYITTRLFWTYHTLVARPLRDGTHGMISREWWYFMFNYFERNVRGPVPRQYNWPFPWPKAKLFSRLS